MERSVRLPVLDGDDIAYEPTERAEFTFGQWTLPAKSGATRRMTPVPQAAPLGVVIPRSNVPSTSRRDALPTPMIAPPPSATRAVALGLAIGTAVGVVLLGVGWHLLG